MFIGLVLGLLTLFSMVLTFEKLPPTLKWWLKEHPLLTDFLAFVFTFIGLTAISKSIAALIGASIAGVGADLALKGMKYLDKNPDVKEQLDKKYEKTVGQAEVRFRDFIMSL